MIKKETWKYRRKGGHEGQELCKAFELWTRSAGYKKKVHPEGMGLGI